MRTSRDLRPFWGNRGDFEDQLRTWGLRTLGTFCAFSWLFEDFLDPLRNFGRPEDLMLSERWRIFQERLMTSCEPIEDLMPLRISMTFQDIEDFANLITYWGLWGRWLIFEDFEVALNTFCGPMRTSRDLRPFWGNRGDFEDHLRTWGLRTLGTFCAFSWLFEDFVDLLRTF